MNTDNSTKYVDGFIHELEQFLDKLVELMPVPTLKKIIAKLPQLNKRTLMKKFYERTKNNKERIMKRDTTLFKTPWNIIPELNISLFWDNLPDHKQEIWETLTKLSIYCSIIYGDKEQRIPAQTLDVNSFVKEMKNNETSEGDMMTQAMTKVKQVVNSSVEPEVSGVMNDLIDGICTDLKTTDITKGNLMENIMGIAMKHPLKLDNMQEFPIDKLMSSAQKLMKNLGMPALDLQNMVKNIADAPPDKAMDAAHEIAQKLGIQELPKLDNNGNISQEQMNGMMKNFDLSKL